MSNRLGEELQRAGLSMHPGEDPQALTELEARTIANEEADAEEAEIGNARAYDIMQSWDFETGIPARDPDDLDQDVPGSLSAPWDYESWKAALVRDDVRAIVEGRRVWGLPLLV